MRFTKNDLNQDCIDFSGQLTFTRNEYGVLFEKDVNIKVQIQNYRSYGMCHKKNRLSRFLYAIPMLWRFCK